MSNQFSVTTNATALLLCASLVVACGVSSGEGATTAETRPEDARAAVDIGADHQDDSWSDTLNDLPAQDLAGDAFPVDVGEGYAVEPQLLVLLPAYIVGGSAGGGWKLSSRSAAASPTVENSVGGNWQLKSVAIGGTP